LDQDHQGQQRQGPVARKPVHSRRLQFDGFERDDGLFDLEARLVDSKPHDFTATLGASVPAHEPIHDMWVRLTIDDRFIVHDVVATTAASPYPVCPRAAAGLAAMKGACIAGGWGGEVKRRLGGTQGCTHLREMLVALGTVAFQSLSVHLRRKPELVDGHGRPVLLDTCMAFAGDADLVAMRWPEHHRPSHRECVTRS
jgi:hypothetical protein